MKCGLWHRILLVLLFVRCSLGVVWGTNIHSAYFFGPNALPIVELHSGETVGDLKLELSMSYFHGSFGDQCFTPNIHVCVPLFTRWVNLDLWSPLVDIYSVPENAYSHFISATHPMEKGVAGGDIYLSTNVQVMHHRWWKYLPDGVVRIGFKTASGGSYHQGRYMDTPGYFFDLNLGREIPLGGAWAKGLRLSGTMGFLCWQTGIARQNDAYTYGLKAHFVGKCFDGSFSWSGYTGWEGRNDRPMSVELKFGVPIMGWMPYVAYLYGVRDYAYQEFRVGLSYSIDILRLVRK